MEQVLKYVTFSWFPESHYIIQEIAAHEAKNKILQLFRYRMISTYPDYLTNRIVTDVDFGKNPTEKNFKVGYHVDICWRYVNNIL